MAEANNPGTPAPAQPQGNEGGQGGTPVGQPGSPRLIAGKYTSVEDAVENGILGMERAFHQTRDEVAKMSRLFEAAVTAGGPPGGGRAPVPVDNRSGYPVGTGRGYDPYGRGNQPPNPDDVDPTFMLTNPGEVLRQRDQRLLGQVVQVVQGVVGNAMTVETFKRNNPDLVKHERIVSAFMRESDQSKNYADQLEDAAIKARNYLTELRTAGGGNANPAPGGPAYVEGPRGGPAPIAPVQIGNPNQSPQSEEEKELMDYISERNADISSRFGINVK